jgi:hypothetical protein
LDADAVALQQGHQLARPAALRGTRLAGLRMQSQRHARHTNDSPLV